MESAEDRSSRLVSDILSHTAVRCFKLDARAAMAEFDRAGTECKLKVDDARLHVEIDRRVAEWQLRLLCDKKAPIATVEAALAQLHSLGYENAGWQAENELYFAIYCVRTRRFDRAREMLQGIHAELSAAELPAEYKNHLIQCVKDWAARNEKAAKKST